MRKRSPEGWWWARPKMGELEVIQVAKHWSRKGVFLVWRGGNECEERYEDWEPRLIRRIPQPRIKDNEKA